MCKICYTRTKELHTSFDATVATIPITHTISVTFTVILSGITGFRTNFGLAICTSAVLALNA